VKALVAYLSVYQYMPYNRIRDMLGAVFGTPLSEGTVDSILGEMSGKAEGAYREIKRRIENSAVVGSMRPAVMSAGKRIGCGKTRG
jgi:transposase